MAICPAPDQRSPHAASSAVWHSGPPCPIHPSRLALGLPPGPLRALPLLDIPRHLTHVHTPVPQRPFSSSLGAPAPLPPPPSAPLNTLWLWGALSQPHHPGDHLPPCKQDFVILPAGHSGSREGHQLDQHGGDPSTGTHYGVTLTSLQRQAFRTNLWGQPGILKSLCVSGLCSFLLRDIFITFFLFIFSYIISCVFKGFFVANFGISIR